MTYNQDKRSDDVQLVIALIITPEGFALAYEVTTGNTADNTTLAGFLAKIEAQYGKAKRTWVMDRGIPTEAILAEMRAAKPPINFLVGTPKGRLRQLEAAFVAQPWETVCGRLQVKLLAQGDELCIKAHIFVAFIAYCLHVTLKHHLHTLASGMTPGAVFEKMAAIQMVNVHLPTTDGCEIVLPTYTQLEKDQQIILQQLKLKLPEQPAQRLSLSPQNPGDPAHPL